MKSILNWGRKDILAPNPFPERFNERIRPFYNAIPGLTPALMRVVCR